MRELLLFVIAAAAGVISGMGMGGGTLLIPALTLLMGIPQRQARIPARGIPKNTKARRTSRETRLWRKVTEVFPRPFNTLPMVVDR